MAWGGGWIQVQAWEILNPGHKSPSVSVKLSAADFGLLPSNFFHLYLGVSGKSVFLVKEKN